MAQWQLPPEIVVCITAMAGTLHARLDIRLLALLTGVLFARGKRTVASWLRGAGVQNDYKNHYYFLGSLGRKIKWVGMLLLAQVLKKVPTGERILLGLDDTPTKRYGPYVEGAGIHHNPTPGPADQKFLYGHVWVTVSLVVRHALWGTIGLPLLAYLYVRQVNLTSIPASYGVKFQTKLEQAAALVEWLALWLKNTGKRLWVVVDGAYAKKPFLAKAAQAGATVVSRVRRDAALWSVPEPAPAGQRRRGGPRTYGAERLSLAKRAGHPRGWGQGTFTLEDPERAI